MDGDASQGRSRTLLWSVVAIVALYVVFVGLLFATGVLSIGGDREENIGAVLALLGVLFSSSLTFVGVLVKQSLDERNQRLAQEQERRLQLEGERNAQLAQEQERRLQLEASIRAVDLLSSSDGKPASPTEQAGALFALADLGQLQLAVTLLAEIWPAGRISSRAAVALVDQTLKSNDRALQELGAYTMQENAARLPTPNGDIDLPTSVQLAWPKHASLYAREALIFGLGKALTSRPFAEWDQGTLNFMFLEFDMIRHADEATTVRAAATLIMDRFQTLATFSQGSLFPDGGPLDLARLRDELAPLAADAREQVTDQLSAALDALAQWLPKPEPAEAAAAPSGAEASATPAGPPADTAPSTP